MNQTPASDREPADISISVVAYHPAPTLLKATLTSLAGALQTLFGRHSFKHAELIVVDNGGSGFVQELIDPLRGPRLTVKFISGHGNVGYGRGHNLAIESASSRYHLILNPDIDMDGDALANGVDFLAGNASVALLTPWIGGEDGNQQYLCRRFPAVLDLLIRGFFPGPLRRMFDRRLAQYEMRDVVGRDSVFWDPPIVSGCFMLFRTDVLKRLNGFDSRYFLYFEDYDLSLRTHEVARVAYVPTVRVRHHGGGASRKGIRHVRFFTASAFRFFHRFGWKWV